MAVERRMRAKQFQYMVAHGVIHYGVIVDFGFAQGGHTKQTSDRAEQGQSIQQMNIGGSVDMKI